MKLSAAGIVMVLGLIVGTLSLRAQPAPSADQVVQRAIARAQQTGGASPAGDFNYTKLSVTEELDSSGKVKDRKERVYEVTYRSGVAQGRLVGINGHQPTADERRKQTESETSLRQLLGQSKGGANENRDNFLTPELAARFDFKIAGLTIINGRSTYQVLFTPKNPELPEHRLADKLLNRISGTLWIDATEFEVARADVFLRSEVNVLGGIAGTLKKLAFTLVRTRIADGIWFSTLSSGDFQGRKLLDSTHIKTQTQSMNFRRMAMNGNQRTVNPES
jgi:hypothetical protein